jgi:hypothetical protein
LQTVVGSYDLDECGRHIRRFTRQKRRRFFGIRERGVEPMTPLRPERSVPLIVNRLYLPPLPESWALTELPDPPDIAKGSDPSAVTHELFGPT